MFYSQLKIPYGTYALKEMLPDLFSDIERNRNTILELTDTLQNPVNFLSVSEKFEISDLELNKIMEKVQEGSNLLVSAHYFNSSMLDTLGLDLDTANVFFGNQIIPLMDEGTQSNYRFSIKDFLIRDTVHIRATDRAFSKDYFVIKKRDIFTYFTDVNETNTRVLARYMDYPILVSVSNGNGKFIISSVPHLLSNIYLLQADGYPFVSYMMSHVPGTKLVWTEFYEIGRGLSNSPLRYILSQPALKLALYTVLGGLILMALFEIKRKQRPIPIVTPPRNDTLEFVQTIGNLYFEGGHHSSIALKRAQFFLEYVRSHYYLETRKMDDDFIKALTRKSQSEKKIIEELVKQIRYINSAKPVSDELLKRFSENLDKFYDYKVTI